MMKEKRGNSAGRKLRVRRGLLVAPAFALLSAAFPAVCSAQTGGLGFLPGGTFSYALGISGNAFAVVGQSGATGFNASANYPYGGEAALWTLPNGRSVQGLGVLSGGSWSYATATNYGSNTTNGSVVVGVSGETNDTTYGNAFIWTSSTGMEDLGLLTGGTFAQAYGVSANSTSTLNAIVVGQADSSNYQAGEAFIWQAGTMHELGALSGYSSSTAFGVSADGSVVVGYSAGSNAGPGSEEAFRWTQSSGMVGLGWLSDGGSCAPASSSAQATNADGTVIVGTVCDGAYVGGEVFRWTCTTGSCTGGTMVGLGTLPGGTWSAPYAVSADGSVVVGWSGSTANPNGEAFIWTPSIGMQSLQSYLGNAAFDGWQLIAATGISADGTVVTGIGTDPNGNAQAWVAYLNGNSSPLKVSHDFNGDGYSDILWRNTSGGQLAMWLMSGGQESSGATLGNVSTSWSVVGQRDFNNDGKADLLWLDGSGDLGLWEMNGTSVSAQIGLGNVGASWKVVGTGDFNGDGTGDILWRDTAGDLAIWLMSNGEYSSGVSLGQVGNAWSVADTGDFNGDGTTDILWYNAQTGDVAIWLMSNGQLASGVGLGSVGTSWSVAGTGDFNGDGTSDILWRDTSGDYAIWLMSNGQFSSGATIASGVSNAWSVAETGDFNGDGKSDILWLCTTGGGSCSVGDLAIWLMNSTSLSSGISLGNVGSSWRVQGQNAD